MKKKYYALFTTQYFIMFAAFGALFPFIGPYSKNNIGATGTEITLLSSLPPLITVISLLTIGYLCDYLKKHNLILNISLLLASLALVLMSIASTFTILLMFYLFYRLVGGALIATDDTIAINKCKDEKMNYGIVRAMGSFGYIVGSLVTGLLTNATGNYKMFMYIAMGCLIVAVFFTFFYPKISISKEPIRFSDIPKIFKNRNYVVLLFTIPLVMGTTNTAIIYDSLFLSELGGEHLVGFISLFSASPELIMMPLFLVALRKFGYKRILMVGTLFMSVRWMTIYSSTHYYSFFAATMIHGLVVGILIPSGSSYIIHNMNKKTLSSALAVYTAASSLCTTIIGMLAGTIYSTTDNIRNVYLLLFFVVILAFLVSTLFNSKEKHHI